MTVQQDLLIREGATFEHVFTHRDSAGAEIDLTGATAEMRIEYPQGLLSAGRLTTESDSPIGAIVLGDEAGTITIQMSPADTRSLLSNDLLNWSLTRNNPDSGQRPALHRLFYDLTVTDSGGDVERVLAGHIHLDREAVFYGIDR